MTTDPELPVGDSSLTYALARAIVHDWEGISKGHMLRIFAAMELDVQDEGSKTAMAYATLMLAQQTEQSSWPLHNFILEATKPVHFTEDPRKHHELIGRVDTALRAASFCLEANGRITPATDGITGAAALTEKLRSKLIMRGTHETVLAYCDQELISHSMFHSVTEATKSLMERLRQWGYHAEDGQDLVQAAFGTRNNPGPWFINDYATVADKAAHHGFSTLLTGIYGHLRNDRSHRARYGSDEEEQDFLDSMSMVSYAHRVLDQTHRVSSSSST